MAGYAVTFSVVDNATKQIDAINRRMQQMRAPMERMSKSVQKFVDVSGLGKIAQGFEWIGRAASSAMRSLAAIVPVLGTITSAATIAGMFKLVSSFAAWSGELQRNADRIGMSAQELQKWEDAARLAGGSAADMDDALKSLKQTSTLAFEGADTEAVAYFNRLGISIRDANGHLRSATELLPEVFAALDRIKDPADRARVAGKLLGDEQAKLYLAFKQSGRGLQDWLNDASRYTELTNEQLASLQQFTQAQGHLGVVFDHLGQQISATLAKNLTPFMNKLAEFVDKHSPEIVAAVDNISTAFTQWIDTVDWDRVKEDINGILELLKTMLTVAEEIGKAIEKTMLLFGLVNRKFTKEDVLRNSPFYAQLTPEQQKLVREQVGMSEEEYAKAQQAQPGVSLTEHPLSWLGNRLFRGGQGNEGIAPIAPVTPPPAANQNVPGAAPGTEARQPGAVPGTEARTAPGTSRQAFYDQQREAITAAARRRGLANPEVIGQLGATQASLESGYGRSGIGPGGYNVYGIKAGGGVGSGSTSVMTHEEIGGQRVAMAQNFATFKDQNEAADAYVDFLEKHPRHYAKVLQAKTIDEAIDAQAKSGYATASNYGSSLRATYAAHGGGAAPATIAQSTGAPQQIAGAPGAPGTSGQVNITVTHQNPPPGSSVSVTPVGDGITADPPRTERQSLLAA